MAPTTLPSLTLFTGVAKAPGTALPGDNTWSKYPSGALSMLARYDLAYRDQYHAFAVAPPPPPPPAPPLAQAPAQPPKSQADPDPETPPALFSPRNDNAPCGADLATNGFDKVWMRATRKSALAALDRRDMLLIKDTATRLTGVFGEIDYASGGVVLDTRVQVPTAGAPPARIGAWSLAAVEGLEVVEAVC